MFSHVSHLPSSLNPSMVSSTASHAPNSLGVYKAKVDGAAKTVLSSFFPRDWDRVQVLDSIKEAFNNKVQVITVRYVGQTSHGFKVEMIIKNNEIITAYPIYTRR